MIYYVHQYSDFFGAFQMQQAAVDSSVTEPKQ